MCRDRRRESSAVQSKSSDTNAVVVSGEFHSEWRKINIRSSEVAWHRTNFWTRWTTFPDEQLGHSFLCYTIITHFLYDFQFRCRHEGASVPLDDVCNPNPYRSVPVVVLWCDLTMYCALSARPSLSADLSPCTSCYKLILLTL